MSEAASGIPRHDGPAYRYAHAGYGADECDRQQRYRIAQAIGLP